MVKKRICFFIFNLLFFQGLYSQEKTDSLFVHFNLKYKNTPLELHKKYISTSDTLEIETFKFYVSNIEIQFTDNTRIKPQDNYHLVDIENLNSLRIPISLKQNKTISRITFNIGVDSIASVSGAMSGDLDATKGMYWAWHSGYINLKIQGKSSSCKTRKNEFQFHIGGYMNPNYAMRSVELVPISQNLGVTIDAAEFFSGIQLSEINTIMIPCKKAMELADLSIKMFKIE